MEQVASSGSEGPQRHAGNHDDSEYDAFLARIHTRFLGNLDGGRRPLFTTDAEGLFDAYLAAFPPEQRQYHTCSSCRHFVRRYGGLVMIDSDGRASSAIWNEEDAPEAYRPAIRAMDRLVRRAKVNGVFLTTQPVWGEPVTGIWKHMAVFAPREVLYRGVAKTAGQAMAEKREDHHAVARALAEFKPELIDQAVTMLKVDSLYRSEKVLGQAEWLQRLHRARAEAKGKELRDNVLWLAIAQAPAGFCHPRSSMIGTLLEDLEAGKPFEDVARAFKAKMHPLQYQRPQAAPSAGNIAQAEKLVEQLGIAASLRRRFARVEEVEALWRPKAVEAEPKAGRVFADLVPKEKQEAKPLVIPAQNITWEKFARTVLPTADRMDLLVPSVGSFAALVTAADPDAPPILQWDLPERRNPVSWYTYHNGSSASNWGLSAGYAAITAIALQPNLWHEPERFKHQGQGLLLLVEGARESRETSLCLFPGTLKSELHGIRAVIEAFSQRGKLEGAADGSACGLILQPQGPWNATVRVTSGGQTISWRIDRWD